MSKNSNDKRVENLNIIDVEVERNGWGRQINSFDEYIYIDCIKINQIVLITSPKLSYIFEVI